MDTLQHLLDGFGVALSPVNLLIAAAGSLIGTVVGLLPGLGPINGVAILMPIAFALGLPPETSLILLAAVYIGCEYGGRISSILLNMPGDAGAIMTTLDGYPMARKGLGGRRAVDLGMELVHRLAGRARLASCCSHRCSRLGTVVRPGRIFRVDVFRLCLPRRPDG